jgi:hypothetical protein
MRSAFAAPTRRSADTRDSLALWTDLVEVPGLGLKFGGVAPPLTG